MQISSMKQKYSYMLVRMLLMIDGVAVDAHGEWMHERVCENLQQGQRLNVAHAAAFDNREI